MAKGKPLGPRVTVEVGQNKVNKKTVKVYSFMLKATADYFGFKPATNPGTTYKKGSTNIKVIIRGCQSRSIKVPAGTATVKGKKITKFKSIPIGPLNATEVRAFLKKAAKNKPKTFVTPDGITHGV